MELTQQLRQFYQKSSESISHGHYDYAIEMLKPILKEAPFHVASHELLQKALKGSVEQNQPSFFNKIIRIFFSEIYSALGHICILMKNTTQAQWYFMLGLIQTPTHARILTDWFHLSLKEGRLDISIVAAESLISARPKEEDILQLANLYFQKSDADQAKHTIQRGLRLFPASPQLTRRLKEIEAERTMRDGDWGKS